MNAVTRIAVAAALMLGLQGCFFSPGKFDSALDIQADGTFTFTYVGELHFVALSDMASGRGEFEPEDCHDDETYEERTCTADEIEQQRTDFEAKMEKDRQEAKQMASLLGGLDASDPEAAQQFAEKLMRQKGWNRVDYRGDGLFDVSYSITSQVGHGFAFPAIEGFPMANEFVQFMPRKDGTVRIDAPAFGPEGASPMSAMMAGMSGNGMTMKESENSGKPKPDGRFTLTVDGEILANNTEEGPQTVDGGQKLSWTVNSLASAAPMALVRPGG